MKTKVFKEKNIKWKRALKIMKERKVEIAEEALKKRLDNLAVKNTSMEKILKENEEKKKKIADELKLKIKQMNETIQKNVERHLQMVEEERLENEQKVLKKINKISDQRQLYMRTFKDNFTNVVSKSLEKFQKNHRILTEKDYERIEGLKERSFEKFADWVNK